jgi:ATP-binding cassette, subfamily C (CFTR/MRP), member 1
MTRGALVTLIYTRLLDVQSDAYETGAAVTLMSTDTDSISMAPQMFHDLWGHVVEVCVGTAMLYSLVGWLWLVPLAFIFRMC